MSDLITTYTKIHINPLNPKVEDIVPEDIAHALSMLSRAGGHFPEFYSVGQHSIDCYREARARGYSDQVCTACLLHDASEAYLADITRPVKKHLVKYLEAEEHLQNAIYGKFLASPLDEEESAKVKAVDDALFYHEFYHFMGEAMMDEVPQLKSQPAFETKTFREVEQEFINILKTGGNKHE